MSGEEIVTIISIGAAVLMGLFTLLAQLSYNKEQGQSISDLRIGLNRHTEGLERDFGLLRDQFGTFIQQNHADMMEISRSLARFNPARDRPRP